MKPTQIILAILSFASAATVQAADDKAKQGWSGKLTTLDGGLQGTVTVSAPDKLTVTDYKLEDASAPALYWWGSATASLSDGFRISNKHVTEKSTGDHETTTIMLDAGKTTADFMTVGLWCEKFSANFGQATLMAQEGQKGSPDTMTSTTGAGMPQMTGDGKTNGGLVSAVEWLWVMAGLGAFTFMLM